MTTHEPLPQPPVKTALQEMTVSEHLEELRKRLMRMVLAAAAGFLAAYGLSEPIIGRLKTLAPANVQFIQITPGEVLLSQVRLAAIVGLVIASPIILYQIMRFVLPGLHGRERGLLLWSLGGGAVLFLLGAWFCYLAVLPPALTWLLSLGQSIAVTQLSIGHYIDFTLSLLLLTGILFELPLLLLFLSLVRLVSSQQLINQWRWAILTIVVVAAVITPSQDPLTLAIVSAAMLALYALSIIPIKLLGR